MDSEQYSEDLFTDSEVTDNKDKSPQKTVEVHENVEVGEFIHYSLFLNGK